jgi:hypothetical protein
MHFFASKRTRIFLPSTISMALMSGSLFSEEPILPKRAKTRHTNDQFKGSAQFNDATIGDST